MQQELKELQPELIQTSKETEQLIKIIAGETVEVEEKKQVGFDITREGVFYPIYANTEKYYIKHEKECFIRYPHTEK